MSEDDRPPDVAEWGAPPPLDLQSADRPDDDPLSPLTEAGILELLGSAGRVQRSLLALLRMDGVSPTARQHARVALQASREVSALGQQILHPSPRRRP